MTSEIIEDKRTIRALYYNDNLEGQWESGGDITIEAYAECGQQSFVPYYKVIKDGVVIARIPGTMVEVSYVNKEGK